MFYKLQAKAKALLKKDLTIYYKNRAEALKENIKTAQTLAEIKSTVKNLYIKDFKPSNKGKSTIKEYKKIVLDDFKQYAKNDIEATIRENLTATLKQIEIRTEWHRSQVWGYNPIARGWCGAYLGEATASGCGYDKLSTVYNSLIDRCENYKKALVITYYNNLAHGITKTPYGTTKPDYRYYKTIVSHFGGCGVGTFENICEYLGANRKNIISTGGDMFDYILVNF